MPDLEVEEVTTSAELEGLAPAWDDLWRRASAATPFQSPAWLLPWWREVGGGELRVLLARQDGRLVGLLPLYRHHEGGAGKLLPLGIAISDYLDGLFEQDVGARAADAMLRHLVEHDDWRRCELHPLRANTPLLEARTPPGCADEILPFEPCLVVEVPAGARDLGDFLPHKIRANLRYFGRRAEQAGRVRFETATAATLPAFLDALFCLHEARWRQRGQPGVLADAAVRRFHRIATPLLLDAGLLRLHALRLNDRIVAAGYLLCAKRRAFIYLVGFAPEHGPISPGALLIGHAMREAVREGAREVDFLRGQERYKYFWGARERPCYGRMLNRAG